MKGKVCLWDGKPLPKRRRKYCCDECSHQYFIHNIEPLWWNNAVRIALARAEHKCEDCGSEKKLEVHHKEPLGVNEQRSNSPLNRQDNLRVLCRPCHELAHHAKGQSSLALAVGDGKIDPTLDKRWKKLMRNSLRLGLITEEEYKRYGQFLGQTQEMIKEAGK